MEREEVIERLRRIEGEIQDLRDCVDSPAIENCMREMWIQLFLAKQYVGVWDAICPEESFQKEAR